METQKKLKKASIYIQKQRSNRNVFRQATVPTKLAVTTAALVTAEGALFMFADAHKLTTVHRVSKHNGQCR
ncbi:hypothetical protein, partial [Desulfovibrio sp.]|uniref:hypothetical protein n=1 Tax=Desulfovibrio sp. TaxID=885 RepID=UPI0025BD215C